MYLNGNLSTSRTVHQNHSEIALSFVPSSSCGQIAVNYEVLAQIPYIPARQVFLPKCFQRSVQLNVQLANLLEQCYKAGVETSVGLDEPAKEKCQINFLQRNIFKYNRKLCFGRMVQSGLRWDVLISKLICLILVELKIYQKYKSESKDLVFLNHDQKSRPAPKLATNKTQDKNIFGPQQI